jgi:hypothetical protein
MTSQHHQPARDPLDAARTQLDFAALASSAPAVKEVLFKAQTMAPYAPPWPWRKATKGAAAAAAVAFMLFAPVIPHQASYALLRVEFEKPFAPARAQQMIDATVRDLPADVLAGVEQRQGQGSQATAPRVVLRFSAAGMSGSRLRHVAEDALAPVANEAQPLYYPAEEYSQGGYLNLVQAVAGFLAPETRPHYGMLGEYGAQAERLLKLEPLLQQELSARLAADGYTVSAFKFAPSGSGLPAGCDFIVPGWPMAAAVGVEGFASELDGGQDLIRAKTTEFLRGFNLALELPASVEPGAQWPAITVAVEDTSGRLNPQLSARVQARLSQPGRRQTDDPTYDPSPAVAAALAQVLPWAGYDSQSSRTLRADGSTGWRVTVVMEGKRSRKLRLFESSESNEPGGDLY